MKRASGWFSSFLIGLACCAVCADEAAIPKHLGDAAALVKQLALERTDYEHGEVRVTWDGACESHTDCSGFVIALLKHAYNYDDGQFEKWFGIHRPTAARFHDAIVTHAGFTEIERVADVQPGDILAIKYKELKKTNTGHMMLVAGPVKQIASRAPLEDDTIQWEIPVIDSSESGHGPTDTRHAKGINGKDHDGLGQGVFRIYADRDGKVAGYSWSLLEVSHFNRQSENHLVIGRLEANYKP